MIEPYSPEDGTANQARLHAGDRTPQPAVESREIRVDGATQLLRRCRTWSRRSTGLHGQTGQLRSGDPSLPQTGCCIGKRRSELLRRHARHLREQLRGFVARFPARNIGKYLSTLLGFSSL
jgi:hypothetical protein